MAGHELTSERLRLEALREEHIDVVFEYYSDERLWTYFPELRPKSKSDFRKLVDHWLNPDEDSTLGELIEYWVVFLRESNDPVGSIQAQIMADGTALFTNMTYIGYHKHGYAKESAEAVIAHLRSEHAIKRVQIIIDPLNTSAVKFAESLGFKLREIRRGVDRLYGLFGDESVYEFTWSATK